MLSPVRRLCCLVLLLVSAPVARALTVVEAGVMTQGQARFQPVIVAGRPALAWPSTLAGGVRFSRALDADGAAWGPPVTVVPDVPAGAGVSLAVVNGNPAVCYSDVPLMTLKFVRATDAEGSAWGAPVTVVPGEDGLANLSRLGIVDGHPAIVYAGGLPYALHYVRAADANGSVWGNPVAVDALGQLTDASMTIVEGRPAIAYTGNGTLWYARARDAAGAAWDAHAAVVSGLGPVFQFPSLQVVNGRPAVGFHDDTVERLRYVRAADATGAQWGVPVTVDDQEFTGMQVTLAVVNGKPAMGYLGDGGVSVRYVEASDADGAAWTAPVLVSWGGFGYTSLAEINGHPSLVFSNNVADSLEYLRRTPAGDGATRWPPFLRVEDPVGDVYLSGGGMDFGNFSAGATMELPLILTNPLSGSGTLHIQSAVIGGPDAAAFAITTPPAATVPQGGSTPMRIKFTAATPGARSARLRIASNSQDPGGIYELTLTSSSAPDITLYGPNDENIWDGRTLFSPHAVPGTARDFRFRIANSGPVELNSLSLVIDGPDAAEFSLAGPFPQSVAAHASGTFTVRHRPLTGGIKTATLHLLSNSPGTRSSYDITLRNISGSLDAAFRPVTDPVFSLALQADGKILTGVTGALQRFLPNGNPDISFFAPVMDGGPACIAVQKDGLILIGGGFNQVNGHPRPGLARILPDGSLDASFNPGTYKGVNCLTVLPNGDILAGGNFTLTDGVQRRNLARLRADGSPDLAFAPEINSEVLAAAVQPDGKILIGGPFTAVNQAPAMCIARLHPNGTSDAFAASFSAYVDRLGMDPSGRIVVSGGFQKEIAFLLPDGSRDVSVPMPGNQGTGDFALQADGKCVVCGTFETAGATFGHRFVRVDARGAPDDSFSVNLTFAFVLRRVALQAGGLVLVAGEFPGFDGLPQAHLARLQNEAALSSLTNSGRSTVRWLRRGTAPEVRDVTFEVKPAASPDWTRLGSAARIPGGWELSGLTMPVSGQIRAQGYAGGSVIEQTASVLTALESWRVQHFNTSANTGDAADDADPDKDGLTNFIEFAFGLNPVDRAGNTLPEFKYANESFTATFASPEGRDDVIYGGEWSSTMLPGTWTDIPDTGKGGREHKFAVSGAASRIFTRFVVRER